MGGVDASSGHFTYCALRERPIYRVIVRRVPARTLYVAHMHTQLRSAHAWNWVKTRIVACLNIVAHAYIITRFYGTQLSR